MLYCKYRKGGDIVNTIFLERIKSGSERKESHERKERTKKRHSGKKAKKGGLSVSRRALRDNGLHFWSLI